MDKFDVNSINKKSIVDYLSRAGYREARSSGKWVFFFSPFRSERNPSFGINTVKNTWSDFGGENGGDLISLVMEIEHLDFVAACKFIEGGSSITFHDYTPPKREKKEITVYARSSWDDVSWEYITQTRGISKDAVSMYCCPVEFFFHGRTQRLNRGVGFRNDLGGWEIRNSFFKVASAPKGVTTILGSENVGWVNMFEGFIDFLSALTYWGVSRLKATSYILNGVGQLPAIIDELNGKTVRYFGDNDVPGNKVLARMKLAGINAVDYRDTYEFYNDFNQFLTSLR